MRRKSFLSPTKQYKSKWHYGLESLLVAKIMKWLKGQKLWHMKIHGSGYQRRGVPDLLVIVSGHAVFLEVKRATTETSSLQEYELLLLYRAGASVCVVRCLEEVKDAINEARQLTASFSGWPMMEN